MIRIMIIISQDTIIEINMIMDIIIIIAIIILKKVETMTTNTITNNITIMIVIRMVHQIGEVTNIKEWVQKLIGLNLIHIKIGKMLMMLRVKEYTLTLMKQLTMNGLKICIIKVINMWEKASYKKKNTIQKNLKVQI